MFTTDLDAFKIQEKELHRRAAQYHLVKSIEQTNSLFTRISASLGRMLILSGQQLINQSRAAAH
jgi:hypothetical protein